MEEAARLATRNLCRLTDQNHSHLFASSRTIPVLRRSLISDGVIPSNEGRGYVLRKIIRRALCHAQRLTRHCHFCLSMVGYVCEMMKDAYPELGRTRSPCHSASSTQKKRRFTRTVEVGLKKLDEGPR